MNMPVIPESPFVLWFLIPFLIFLSRVLDVSIGSLRMLCAAKGQRIAAPLLGFCEILIWITALRAVLSEPANPLFYIAYAAGFAAGTFTGIRIDEALSEKFLLLTIFPSGDPAELRKNLKENGYQVTIQTAEGEEGERSIIRAVIAKKDEKKALSIIRAYSPQAIFTFEEAKAVTAQKFRSNGKTGTPKQAPSLRWGRKGK
jgi:uncharacterized protein YebE (UPF0316 family)